MLNPTNRVSSEWAAEKAGGVDEAASSGEVALWVWRWLGQHCDVMVLHGAGYDSALWQQMALAAVGIRTQVTPP